MHTQKLAFFCALAVAAPLWAGKLFPQQAGEAVVPNQILIKMKPGVSARNVIPGIVANAVIGDLALPDHFVVKLPSGLPPGILTMLASNPNIDVVEPDRIRTGVGTPNDPTYSSQWSLSTVQAQQAWDRLGLAFPTAATASPARLKIAVLDTGADCTHPDFMNSGGASTDSAAGGQISWSGSQALTATTVSPAACAWQDDHGHGTHVSGIIAAATGNSAGVASLGFSLQLLEYKVLDNSGSGSDSTIANAIIAAVNAGAKVISMSLGGAGYSQTLQNAIDYAWQKNVVVVAAAGNSSTSALYFPGGANHTIGVSATDSSNNLASFSNYGNYISVAAPGVGIVSTIPTYSVTLGCCNYGSLSGTSMATPLVSALAGLVAGTTSNASAAAIIERIQQSASSSASGAAWNSSFGYGVINAYNAVNGTAALASTGGVVGQAQDTAGNPISGAQVTVAGQSFTTDVSGLYWIRPVNAGTYPISISASGYATQNLTVTVGGGADTSLTVSLGAAYGNFTGTVANGGSPVRGAIVQAQANGRVVGNAITDAAGKYTLWVAAGSGYTLQASEIGIATVTLPGAYSVSAGGSVAVDFGGTVTTPSTQVTTLNCSPATLASSASATCTVSLSAAAPAGGASVALQSSSPLLSVPSSITVPAGALSASFSASAGTISSNQTATVTASLSGSAATASISLSAPGSPSGVTVSSLSCGAPNITSWSGVSCLVSLSGPAPTGGAVVALSASPAVSGLSIPASTTIPAGVTQGYFGVSAAVIPSGQTVTITASFNGSSAQTSLALGNGTPSVSLSSLACSPSTLASSTSATCTVSLSAAAPAGGTSVALQSSSPLLTVPASVTVSAGASSASFSASAGTVSSNQTATVTASLGGSAATANISLSAPGSPSGVTVSSLSCGASNISSWSSVSCLVSLSGPAPTGGAVVTLSASPVVSGLSIPASTTIPAGVSQAYFGVSATVIPSGQTVTITASLNGSSAHASLALGSGTPSLSVSSLACSPSTLASSTSATCTVNLSAAAPAGGTSVTLQSSSPLLTVPPSVTVAAGSSSASFAAAAGTISSNQTATVTASISGSAATASISLSAPGSPSGVTVSSLSCGASTITSWASVTCLVTLSGPAPSGGAVVTISGSPLIPGLSMPASTTIPAGATQGYFGVGATVVPSGDTVLITASFNGSSAQTSLGTR